MSEEKEVKTWYAYFSDWQDLSKGIIQKEQWALMLNSGAEFQVVDKQAYESLSQLLKEKEETIQSLQKSLFGRSAHADVMEHKATRVNALLREKEVEIANLKKALNHAYKQYSLHITTFAGNHIPMVAKLKKECEALAKGDGDESV